MDWLEIPNLPRATGYIRYLCERYLFGAREVVAPDATAGRTGVVSARYGVASSVYRAMVTVAILLFLGELSPLLGILFAAMTTVGMLVVPVAKGLSICSGVPRSMRCAVPWP